MKLLALIIVIFSTAAWSGDLSHLRNLRNLRNAEMALAEQAAVSAESGNFDWKVGDTLNFNMKIKPLPLTAAAVLKVTQMTDDEATLVEEIGYKKFKNTVETVLDRNTGKIVRMKVNGKDKKVPDASGTTLVTEEESHIKVKAGEFDAIHVVTKDKNGSTSEAWINPAAVPVSGLLMSKTVQSFLTVEMELTSFSRGH